MIPTSLNSLVPVSSSYQPGILCPLVSSQQGNSSLAVAQTFKEKAMETIGKIASPVISFFHEKLTYRNTVSKSMKIEKTSSVFPTKRVPQAYWDTKSGKAVLEIAKILKRENVLSNISPNRTREDLETCARKDSLNIGEATAELIRLSGTDIDRERSSISLTLLHLLRKAILQRIEDTRLSLNALREHQGRDLSDINEKVNLLNNNILTADNLELEQISQETRKLQKSLHEKAKKVREEAKGFFERQESCQKAMKALAQIEKKEFQRDSMQLVTQEILTSQEDARKFFNSLSSSLDASYARIAVCGPHYAVRSVRAVALGDENALFIPRLGTVRYSSKAECLEAIQAFIHNAMSSWDGTVLDVSLWRDQAPVKESSSRDEEIQQDQRQKQVRIEATSQEQPSPKVAKSV